MPCCAARGFALSCLVALGAGSLMLLCVEMASQIPINDNEVYIYIISVPLYHSLELKQLEGQLLLRVAFLPLLCPVPFYHSVIKKMQNKTRIFFSNLHLFLC